MRDLGLKSLHQWNEALMARHLWNVISDRESIWVKWVKIHWLRGKSVWTVETHTNTSWSWKQILSLRDKIRNFVHFRIGNGNRCNFWLDKWNDKGPLCDLVNHEDLRNAKVSFKEKVADLIRNGDWRWPRSWNDNIVDLINTPVPSVNAGIEDKAVWINKKGKEKKFVVQEVWKELKPNAAKVIWFNHVWFSQCA